MGEKLRRLIEGFRWLCTPDKTPCELCAAYCGQEFYYDPEPGQNDAKGVKRPPLHPHCRCGIELLTNQLRVLAQMTTRFWGAKPGYDIPGLSPYFNTGTIGYFGLVCGSDGRPLDSPNDGNYGGEGWSFGMNEEKIAERAAQANMSEDEYIAYNYRPPIHSMDSAFEDHDYQYRKHNEKSFFSEEKLAADRTLVGKLREIGPDPLLWPDPPTTEDGIYSSKRFYGFALDYFEGKEAYADLLKLKGREYMRNHYPIVFPFYDK